MRLAGMALLLLAAVATADDFSGEYVTSLGRLVLEQKDASVTGSYGEAGGNEIEGRVVDGELRLSWKAADGSVGTAALGLREKGRRLEGSWKCQDGRGGAWRGWRCDPGAEKGKAGRFGGLWRFTPGLLELHQKGSAVTGTFGPRERGVIEGVVRGRRLHLKWSSPSGAGTVWLEIAPGSRDLFGISTPEGSPETCWFGQLLTEHETRARPKPEEIVLGVSETRLTYCIRVPPGWRAGRKVPAVVLLHDANSNAESYLAAAVRIWPDLARAYVLIGIDGERWNDQSPADDPRHDYGLDGAIPDLVRDVVEELRKRHRLHRVFVGGHGRGGTLTYLLALRHPETFAGAFPMAAGITAGVDPGAFGGDGRKSLRVAQRATPMAIVHGEADEVVPYATSLHAHERFLAHGFPMLGLVGKPVGHGFAFLPVAQAVRWLDALTTEEEEELLAFAQRSLAAKRWRDVGAAVVRAGAIRVSGKSKRRFAEVAELLDEASRPGAEELGPLLRENADGSWLAAFLKWRVSFELAPCARPVMEAYERLRAEHEEPAKVRLAEARAAFGRGDDEGGRAIYREILERYPAASCARSVVRWLAETEG